MKKRLSSLFILSTLLCFNSINIEEHVVSAAIGTTPPISYSPILSANYYDNVSGLSGDYLLEGLATISLGNHKYYTTYEEITGGNAFSDVNPNNSNEIIDFYTGWSITNQWDGGIPWNREHVWCQSLSSGLYSDISGSDRGAGGDIHHIRPEIKSINSDRNNGLYTDRKHCGNNVNLTSLSYNVTNEEKPYISQYNGMDTGCYNAGQSYFEPRDEVKGDVARILMYLYMHYSNEVEANSSYFYAGALDITNIAYTADKTDQSSWNMLLNWNALDPVDTFEEERNSYCASVTGVRNPFIDHPEFANMIWDESYLGKGALLDTSYVENDYFVLTSTADILEPNETIQISYDTNIDDSNVTYVSDNVSVATVSPEGLVSAVSSGKANITVTCGSMSKDFTVVVFSKTDIKITGTYELVTDESELEVDDNIIIVGKKSVDDYYAMSTTQNNNNRGAESITIDGTTAYINEEVQELTLKSGNKDNTYSFYTGSGYLYAASSSSNILKTQTSLNDNGSWTIEIDSSGSATVKAQETYTRNWLMFNAKSSLFSCYASGQNDIYIYKEVEENDGEHTHSYTYVEEILPTCKSTGVLAHYKCRKCNAYFTVDKEPTTLEELTLDVIDHSYQLQEEEQSTCTAEGMMAHYTCGTCDKLFTKENDVYIEKTTQELTISKKNHTYNYVEEMEASCESNGVKEHYECDICQRLFVKVDEEFVETTLEDITIPSSHNIGELIPEILPSCEQSGMKAYYKCSVCNKYFTEEKVETTYQDLQVPATNHNFGEKIARVEPTCENDGTRAHYQCSECQKLFVLTSGSYVEVTEADLRIPQSGHSFNTIDKVEESCTTTGVALHYQCKICNNLFIKENGVFVKVSEEQLVVNPKRHEYTLVEGVNPTCKEEGLLSHYKCSACDKLFVKENDNYKEVKASELVLAVIDHSYGQEIAAVNATCDTNGNSAYYKCSECEKLFIKSGSSYISVTQQEVTITAYGHNYYKVNGKTPTCKEEGLKEHYKCSRCNKVFFLENNQYVVTNESALTLAKVEHSYDNECDTTCNTCNQEREVPLHIDENEDNKCDYCGTEMEIKNNKTRNIVFISIGGGVLLLGLAFLLLFKRF